MSDKQSMRDRMSIYIANYLREKIGNDVFIQLSYNTRGNSVSVDEFSKLQKDMIKEKTKIQISDIKPIKNEIVNFIQVNRGLRNHPLENAELPASTGIYEIQFNNDQVMMIGTWLNFRGEMEAIIGGTAYAWKLLHVEQAKSMARQEKPKTGIYQISIERRNDNRLILKYNTVPWTFKGKVIHPQIATIRDEITSFFGNIPRFSRYGQVPFRKLITIGAPGTGKSSINFLLAEEMKKNYSIVFSQSINEIALHMSLCAKHDVPTIIFFDDSENTLASGDAAFLNFLSGSNTPNIKKGCIIIFTSNMTAYIEDRVLRRPGRIDNIINVGALVGMDLLNCARMYFEELDWTEKTDAEWISLLMVQAKDENGRIKKDEYIGLTGAEIQGLAQLCYVKANSTGKVLSYELVEEVKHEMEKNLNEAYNMMAENSMVNRFKKKDKVLTSAGFKLRESDNLAF